MSLCECQNNFRRGWKSISPACVIFSSKPLPSTVGYDFQPGATCIEHIGGSKGEPIDSEMAHANFAR